MQLRTFVIGSAILVILASFVACGWCLWDFSRLSGRPIGAFDIGDGCVLGIWSEQSQRDWPGGPVPIFYHVLGGDEEIVPTTYLGSDRGQRFEFKPAFADGGRLVCIFDVNLTAKKESYCIFYDAGTRESYPP